MVNMHCSTGYSLMTRLSRKLESIWYTSKKPNVVLRLLALCFGLLSGVRKQLYSLGVLRQIKIDVPIIVVGNINVGGTGKTSVTLWLAGILQKQGKLVGIISRGYGGSRSRREPILVSKNSNAEEVGDESLYLARESEAIVCVCVNKVRAAETLVSKGADIIISDDGLQHYPLARDFEILIIDSSRGFGNGYLLPAGPLRERPETIQSFDYVLINGDDGNFEQQRLKDTRWTKFRLLDETVKSLNKQSRESISFFSESDVLVLAGIGNQERFYKSLKDHGIIVQPVPVDDHGRVNLSNLRKGSDLPILMTPKDAVKYDHEFPKNSWLVQPTISFDNENELIDIMKQLVSKNSEID